MVGDLSGAFPYSVRVLYSFAHSCVARPGDELCQSIPVRLRALFVGAFVFICLVSCDNSDERTSIRFGLATGPVTLDPRFATDGTSARINRLLYARLVEFDDALRPVAALATWKVISPTHYRFYLRPDRETFADGTIVTATDVKATYDAVRLGTPTSPHAGGLKGIAQVEVIDEQTVDFKLNAIDTLFPGKLVVGILPAIHLDTRAFNRQPMGSGPFMFERWPEEGRLVLRRRADGQVVEFVTVKDPNTRVLKLLNKEVDLLQGDLSPEMVRWLEGNRALAVQRTRGTKFAYLGFNLEDPIVGDVRVRRAIGHAIDRNEIIKYVMGQSARLAGGILPSTHWAGLADSDGIAFDLERAQALLREAGYAPGHGPSIVYTTSAAPFRIRLATIIQAQLTRAGFDVSVRSNDWGTFYGDVKAGRFQMYSLAWVGIKMPDIFRYVFHSSAVPPKGANRGRFRSDVADGLIEDAESSPDLAGQARYYRELQAHVLEALPYVPLWYEDTVQVARTTISGYVVNADGNYDGMLTIQRAPDE